MRLGLDLGGTKIEGAVLDAGGAVLARRRVPTPARDYDATLRALADLVAALEADVGATCPVGLCTPGSANPATGRLRNCNATALNGRPLQADLEDMLRRPVRLANDADCFALSEATDGAGAGADVVFGVILGTGVGGGVVVRGRLVRGRNAIAGEWGHNPLPGPRPDELPGPPCYCGRRGCVETFLAGPALARDAGLAPEALAATDDPAATRARDRYVDRLARALATVINLLDPDVIVLGGGLSAMPWLYEHVPRAWCEHVFSDVAPTTALRPAAHGPASGVRGAAWLWAHA